MPQTLHNDFRIPSFTSPSFSPSILVYIILLFLLRHSLHLSNQHFFLPLLQWIDLFNYWLWLWLVTLELVMKYCKKKQVFLISWHFDLPFSLTKISCWFTVYDAGNRWWCIVLENIKWEQSHQSVDRLVVELRSWSSSRPWGERIIIDLFSDKISSDFSANVISSGVDWVFLYLSLDLMGIYHGHAHDHGHEFLLVCDSSLFNESKNFWGKTQFIYSLRILIWHNSTHFIYVVLDPCGVSEGQCFAVKFEQIICRKLSQINLFLHFQ